MEVIIFISSILLIVLIAHKLLILNYKQRKYLVGAIIYLIYIISCYVDGNPNTPKALFGIWDKELDQIISLIVGGVIGIPLLGFIIMAVTNAPEE